MIKITNMLNKVLKRSLNSCIDENKYLRKQKEVLINDFIRTLNLIEDVDKLRVIDSKEKELHRNIIINKKRKEYIDKIIELETLRKKNISNS